MSSLCVENGKFFSVENGVKKEILPSEFAKKALTNTQFEAACKIVETMGQRHMSGAEMKYRLQRDVLGKK